MTDLTSLIERVAAATEGGRELDHAIHYQVVVVKSDRFTEQSWTQKATAENWNTPRYSTSIDAVLTLLPEGLEFEFTNLYGVAAVSMGINTESPCYARREDGNITLALLSAILRARQTEATND